MKIITQNLWFEAQQRPQRMSLHLQQWQDAQIIAVQEATLACLRLLLQDTWLSTWWTSARLDDPAWQGVAVFSQQIPDSLEMLPLAGTMGRRLLKVGWPHLMLGVVHLESTASAGPVRRQQMRQVAEHLAGYPEVLWLGDFNFCARSAENAGLPSDYQDLWTLLRPGQPGDTVKQRGRYDRMLWRGPQQRPTSIGAIGTDFIASDHLGLCLELAP